MDDTRGERVGRRARQAGIRAEPLRRRRAELRAGRHETAYDAARAAAAGDAYRAARHAVNAYLSVAAAHHRAADRLERYGQSARAREHRDLASADVATAAVAQRTVDAQRPASPPPTQDRGPRSD